jgi:hypothetical protein
MTDNVVVEAAAVLCCCSLPTPTHGVWLHLGILGSYSHIIIIIIIPWSVCPPLGTICSCFPLRFFIVPNR